MTSKISQKINYSSQQVLKTLKVLFQGNYTMNELIQKLNKAENDFVFNNSIISKYINTCRFCNIYIPKIHNKYYVAKLPFGFELSTSDINILKLIQEVAKNEVTGKWLKIFDNLAEKLNRYSNTKITTVDKDAFNLSFELFEQAVAQKRKVRLLFKNRDILECVPIDISQKEDKVFFNVFNKRIRQIDAGRLSGIQFSDNSFVEPFNGKQTVVFKLKGGLAKRYEARENETVELCPDGSILVTNRDENEDYLISRLLRYDDKCEVIGPKTFRGTMIETLNNMLKNYGDS